jgi:hypothetical protein
MPSMEGLRCGRMFEGLVVTCGESRRLLCGDNTVELRL